MSFPLSATPGHFFSFFHNWGAKLMVGDRDRTGILQAMQSSGGETQTFEDAQKPKTKLRGETKSMKNEVGLDNFLFIRG